MHKNHFGEKGKRKYKDLPCRICWWGQLHWRLENLQRATPSDYKKPSWCRACSQLQLIHQQNSKVPDGPWHLLHLLGCLSAMGPHSGKEHGYRTCHTTGTGESGAAQVGTLSPRAGTHPSLCCNLQDHNTPSHSGTPQTSYLKIQMCCKTGRTEGGNVFFIVSVHVSSPLSLTPLPFIHFLFPFSVQLVLS